MQSADGATRPDRAPGPRPDQRISPNYVADANPNIESCHQLAYSSYSERVRAKLQLEPSVTLVKEKKSE